MVWEIMFMEEVLLIGKCYSWLDILWSISVYFRVTLNGRNYGRLDAQEKHIHQTVS